MNSLNATQLGTDYGESGRTSAPFSKSQILTFPDPNLADGDVARSVQETPKLNPKSIRHLLAVGEATAPAGEDSTKADRRELDAYWVRLHLLIVPFPSRGHKPQ